MDINITLDIMRERVNQEWKYVNSVYLSMQKVGKEDKA